MKNLKLMVFWGLLLCGFVNSVFAVENETDIGLDKAISNVISAKPLQIGRANSYFKKVTNSYFQKAIKRLMLIYGGKGNDKAIRTIIIQRFIVAGFFDRPRFGKDTDITPRDDDSGILNVTNDQLRTISELGEYQAFNPSLSK